MGENHVRVEHTELAQYLRCLFGRDPSKIVWTEESRMLPLLFIKPSLVLKMTKYCSGGPVAGEGLSGCCHSLRVTPNEFANFLDWSEMSVHRANLLMFEHLDTTCAVGGPFAQFPLVI